MKEQKKYNSKILLIVLGAALLNGLVYLFLAPPWQHYDEPKHFEYAWLAANLGRLPQPGDYDATMSRLVTETMAWHDFFGKGITPEQVIKPGEEVMIFGLDQLGEPPFYYLAASLPLRLLHNWGMIRQLYAARLVSVGFLLVTVFAAWGIAAELTRNKNPLRWMLPLTVALLPAFVDLMSAVNNDAAAVAVFSLFFWGATRLVRNGFRWLDFLWAGGMAVLSYFTKTTAMIALPLFVVALLFAVFRGKLRWLAWTSILVGLLIILAISIEAGDAAGWYRATTQTTSTRVVDSKAVTGKYVLQLEGHTPASPSWLVPLSQPVPGASGDGHQGHTYTLGGWMWASQAVQGRSPAIGVDGELFFTPLELSTDPVFFTVTTTLPDHPFNRVWISLDPAVSGQGQANIYYDGLVFAEGERPADHPPIYSNDLGSQGTWGGGPFENLLRNGSSERSGLRLRSQIDRLGSRLLPDEIQPSFLLGYLLDVRGSMLVTRLNVERLLRTFWSQFSWGNVPMIGSVSFPVLLGITLIGFLGTVIWLVRRMVNEKRKFPWELTFFVFLTLFAAWGAAVLRGSIYISVPRIYLSVARYTYVAIIPTLLLLTNGWAYLLAGMRRLFRLPEWAPGGIYITFLLILDFIAIMSIYRYFS